MSLPDIQTVRREESLDSMEWIAQKALALHLSSRGITPSPQALEQLFELFGLHIDQLLSGLQKITHTQRRHKASPKDLAYLLRDFNIPPGELEGELEATRQLPQAILNQKALLEREADQALHPDLSVSQQDPSFVFFAHDEDIIKLIPPSHKKGAAILSWLPEFPPDHTYRHTANYTQRITDQSVVRTKLAEESRLGEQALEHLIMSERQSVMPSQRVSVDPVDHYEDDEATKSLGDGTQLTIPAVEKPLDIVQYASERLTLLAVRKSKKKEKQTLSAYDTAVIALVKNNATYSDHYDDSISAEQFVEEQFAQTLATFTSLKERREARELERAAIREVAKKRRDEAKGKELDFNEFDEFDNFDNFDQFDEPPLPPTMAGGPAQPETIDFDLMANSTDGNIDSHVEATQNGDNTAIQPINGTLERPEVDESHQLESTQPTAWPTEESGEDEIMFDDVI